MIGRNVISNVSFLTVLGAVALQNERAKAVHICGHFNVIAAGLHSGQRIEKALKYGQIRCGSNSAGIWRKAKQHNANLFVSVFFTAQICQPRHFFCQHINAFMTRCHSFADGTGFAHISAALTARLTVATCVDCGVCGAVNLGQGDEHCCFNGAKATVARRPLAQRLKFKRMSSDIRNIKLCKCFDRGVAVVVGRSTNKAETSQ